MKARRGAIGLVGTVLIASAILSLAQQRNPEVRRAQPVTEPPVARAIPFDSPTPTPPRPRRVAPSPPPDLGIPTSDAEHPPVESSSTEEEAADKRQLDYANGLFARKLYDLAAPEYEKYLGQYPGIPGRASA